RPSAGGAGQPPRQRRSEEEGEHQGGAGGEQAELQGGNRQRVPEPFEEVRAAGGEDQRRQGEDEEEQHPRRGQGGKDGQGPRQCAGALHVRPTHSPEREVPYPGSAPTSRRNALLRAVASSPRTSGRSTSSGCTRRLKASSESCRKSSPWAWAAAWVVTPTSAAPSAIAWATAA